MYTGRRQRRIGSPDHHRILFNPNPLAGLDPAPSFRVPPGPHRHSRDTAASAQATALVAYRQPNFCP